MRSTLKLSHKGLILIAVPLVFEIAFVVVLAVMLQHAQDDAQRQAESKEVVAVASNLSNALLEAGYALITWKALRSNVFVDEYEKSIAQVPEIFQRLDALSVGNERRQEQLKKIKTYADRIIHLTANFRRPSDSIAMTLISNHTYGVDLERNFRQFLLEVRELDHEEEKLQQANPAAQPLFRSRLYQLLAGAVLFNILLTVMLALFFSKGITKRLDILSDNAQRLAKRQDLNKLVAGSDEIANLDQVFHKVADDLNKAEQRKQEFVSMVSHDLRTPLTTLQTTFSLIEDSKNDPSEDNAPRIARAKRNISRMIQLIGQLLDIEKLEAGMLKIHPVDSDLNLIIERALESVNDFAQEKGMKLSADHTDARVFADDERLGQVLANLLSNAIKFSPPGNPIAISVEPKSNVVKISVKDQGCGIAKADLGKIFDRFQQVKREQTSQSGGTGLGLAICKGLIEAHQGAMGVESEPGKGSTFWFSIPKSGTESSASS